MKSFRLQRNTTKTRVDFHQGFGCALMMVGFGFFWVGLISTELLDQPMKLPVVFMLIAFIVFLFGVIFLAISILKNRAILAEIEKKTENDTIQGV